MALPFSSANAPFQSAVGPMVAYYCPNPPAIASVTPGVGVKRRTVPVVVAGANLTGATALSFGDGVTVNSFTVESETQIAANITILVSCTSGFKDVWLVCPSGAAVLRSGFAVLKAANYILAQAFNPAMTASQVIHNSGIVPEPNNFAAEALWTDSQGAGRGCFSEAPQGRIAYCNGVDSCIWGGEEIPCTAFITATAEVTDIPADPADFTDAVLNTRQDVENVAVIGGTGGKTMLVRSPIPIQGVSFYIADGQENTTASTMTGKQWTGSAWASLTITDGTSVGGKTLARTGAVTFASTAATSRLKYIEGNLGYWYQFTISDGAAEIYYVTLDAPFQRIVDIWDGLDRDIAAFFKYTTTYEDLILNVNEDYYEDLDEASYADLDSFGAFSSGNNCILIGTFERATGFNINVPPDKTNSTAATAAAVDYWDGTGFVTVGAIVDGTSEGGISLAKSGTVSFTPPDAYKVFKRTVANNSVSLYYYRLRFDKTLDSSTAIYYVSSIPAPRQIRGYKFPLYSQNRLMLCCNMDGKRNSILISADETCQVFNGQDSLEVEFGNHEELNCGCTTFAQYGSNLLNITMLFKDREVWGLVKNESSWTKYRISPTIGCTAPRTLDVVIVPPIEGQQNANRCFAIWMDPGSGGFYVSDGRNPILVSDDIRDLFDQTKTEHIALESADDFAGFVDKGRMEYHVFMTLNTGEAEYVLDLKRWKWFRADRGTGKSLKCGINVTDQYGNSYAYGFIDSGYMLRLEYGNTFDGTSITSTLHTGDFPLDDGNLLVECEAKAFVPILAAKTVTSADVTLTHYVDTATTGTAYTIDPANAGHRLAFPAKGANSAPGILHSVKMSITTSDESCGFEPFAVAIYHQPVREHNYV